MEKGLVIQSKNRVAAAREKLTSASILLREGQFKDAISRAYYAMYYAATALLIQKGEAPKTHKGVLVLLHQYFIKEGVMDTSFAKMLEVVKQQREDADYEPELVVDREDAEGAHKKAEDFVSECERLLSHA